jgi:fused signal recognition particle receptor
MNWDSIKRLFGVSTKSEGTPRSNDGIFNSLSKSRELLGKKLANLFAKFAVGHVADEISHQALLTELEELLYSADLGSEIVEILLQELSRMAKPWQRETIMARWYQILVELLPPLTNVTPSLTPKTILMIGVNGVGKTTSTAKLANFYKNVRHQRVLLAAADTYRAGAIEQLKIWAQRLDIDCIHQQEGADPAAVVFDAITAAKSRTIDVLIVDTGGGIDD